MTDLTFNRIQFGDGLAVTDLGSGAIRVDGGGGGGGAVILDEVLSVPQATIDTSTILGGSLPTTTSHLLWICQARTTGAVSSRNVIMRFNGDSGANYYSEYLDAVASSVTSSADVSDTSMIVAEIPGAGATPGFAGQFEISIVNYQGTTFAKNALARSIDSYNLTSSISLFSRGGTWNNTAAVTRIQLIAAVGDSFAPGSRFTLYGMDSIGGGGGGGGGAPGATFIFTQSAPSATWTVVHNLGEYPSVTVIDTGDSVVIPSVHYDSNNQLTISFGSATSGKAYLN